jgi:hypothetical protein
LKQGLAVSTYLYSSIIADLDGKGVIIAIVGTVLTKRYGIRLPSRKNILAVNLRICQRNDLIDIVCTILAALALSSAGMVPLAIWIQRALVSEIIS